MADVEVLNGVPADEASGWLTNVSTSLLGDPHSDNFPRRVHNWLPGWDAERTWGARADGRWVGTLATRTRTLTVPGAGGATRDLAADAVTAVTVAATHRRRGLLTAMIGESLAAARDRGDALSMLIAAEWPIYGRYGFAPASQEAHYTYFPREPNAKPAPVEGGTLRMLERAEVGRLGPGIFDAARRTRHGQVDRGGAWWARACGLDGYQLVQDGPAPTYVVHEGPDGPDGLVSWTVSRDFELDGSLGAIKVGDLVAASDTAYRNLWAYLAGIDVISEVTLSARAVDEPVRWLLRDGRALRQTFTGDGLWLRLLDVPAALAARHYAVTGRLMIEVVDDADGGYAAGRYALDAGPDGAECTRTAESADLVLSARALASAYLGGYSFAALRLGGGVDELSAGAIARGDAMFGTPLAPWNATGF